jgi:hypothetical protein
MLILDFSKAFDTVPHTRLLRKLDQDGVRCNIHGWLESWLTTREQNVLVDGEKSRSVKVKSGVPQGTALRPLMFLLYINDIGENIGSSVRLFADDSLEESGVRHGVKSLAEIKDEHIHLLLLIQVSDDFLDCDY